MATQERGSERLEFVRLLAEAGFSPNFLVIDLETAKSVLTERRMELLETIREGAVPESQPDEPDHAGQLEGPG